MAWSGSGFEECTSVGGKAAIVPAVRGSAWITSISQMIVDHNPSEQDYVASGHADLIVQAEAWAAAWRRRNWSSSARCNRQASPAAPVAATAAARRPGR